jgi:hypothetical protein
MTIFPGYGSSATAEPVNIPPTAAAHASTIQFRTLEPSESPALRSANRVGEG